MSLWDGEGGGLSQTCLGQNQELSREGLPVAPPRSLCLPGKVARSRADMMPCQSWHRRGSLCLLFKSQPLRAMPGLSATSSEASPLETWVARANPSYIPGAGQGGGVSPGQGLPLLSICLSTPRKDIMWGGLRRCGLVALNTEAAALPLRF